MKLLLRALSPVLHWQRFRLLLLLLFVARGVVYIVVLPPFAGCDEYQHVAYLVHLDERGRTPIFGEAHVSRTLLRNLAAFPHPPRALEQMRGTTALPYSAYWDADPRPVFRDDQPDVLLYQAQQGPLYYRLVKPLFDAAGGGGDLARSIAALRLLNLGLAALAMWLVLGAAGRWIRARPLLGLVALAVSWQPFFLGTACRVANDAPGMLVATIVVLLVTGRRRPSIPWAVGIGLSIGLAALLKPVNLALVPFACGWVMCVVRSGRRDPRDGHEGTRTRGRRIATAAMVAIVALAVVGPSMYASYRRHGTLTSMQEAVYNRRGGRGAAALWESAQQVQWGVQVRDLWARNSLWTGGWGAISPPRLLRLVYAVGLGVAFLGWLVGALRRRRVDGGVGVAIFLAACFMMALSVHIVHSQAHWGGVTTDARYSAAALPWWVLGALAAASGWGRFGQATCAFTLAVLFALAEVRGVVKEMVPEFSALPFGTDSLSRLASVQPVEAGVTTFWVAVVCASVCGGLAFVAALAATVTRGPRPTVVNEPSRTKEERQPRA